MPPYQQPEQQAREQIDAMLEAAGWEVQTLKNLNLHAGRGVTLSEVETPIRPVGYMLRAF